MGFLIFKRQDKDAEKLIRSWKSPPSTRRLELPIHGRVFVCAFKCSNSILVFIFAAVVFFVCLKVKICRIILSTHKTNLTHPNLGFIVDLISSFLSNTLTLLLLPLKLSSLRLGTRVHITWGRGGGPTIYDHLALKCLCNPKWVAT